MGHSQEWRGSNVVFEYPMESVKHGCCGRCPDSNTEVRALRFGQPVVHSFTLCGSTFQSLAPSAIRREVQRPRFLV